MTDEPRACLDPEVLAAFVAGNVTDREASEIADHLLTCADCRDIVREIAYMDRVDRGEEQVRPAVAAAAGSTVRPWWIGLAAAAVVIAVVGVAIVRISEARADNIRQLIAAMPRGGRSLEPRLSGGFPWAPLGPASRGDAAAEGEQMRLIGAAGAVLRKTSGDSSPRARHAAALAQLVSGHPEEAARILSATPSDAATWSDLAAARYTLGVQTNDRALIADALAATDAALRVRPDLPEALFNRALIVQRLDRPAAARDAWQRYLAVDRESPWAGEARQHLISLASQ